MRSLLLFSFLVLAVLSFSSHVFACGSQYEGSEKVLEGDVESSDTTGEGTPDAKDAK